MRSALSVGGTGGIRTLECLRIARFQDERSGSAPGVDRGVTTSDAAPAPVWAGTDDAVLWFSARARTHPGHSGPTAGTERTGSVHVDTHRHPPALVDDKSKPLFDQCRSVPVGSDSDVARAWNTSMVRAVASVLFAHRGGR